MTYSLITGVFILIVIIYIYYIQFYTGHYPKIFLDRLIDDRYLKTGDMLIFKAYNNFNSVFLGSYYGHMGIVYIDPNDETQTPMLFEANGIEFMPLLDHHNKNGIFFTPVKERIQKYKGRVFVKSLNHPVCDLADLDFKEFISYCLNNMKYDHRIIKSWLKKITGVSKCGKNTNCGELVFLSLIKLNLLPEYSYEQRPSFHHVSDMVKIKHLLNNKYNDPIEIVDHPFAE